MVALLLRVAFFNELGGLLVSGGLEVGVERGGGVAAVAGDNDFLLLADLEHELMTGPVEGWVVWCGVLLGHGWLRLVVLFEPI